MSHDRLAGLFKPRSVAFVGASSELDTYAGRPLGYTKAWGFQGAVYPVNPRREEIAGTRCYPSVRAIEDDVDLAVLLLPARLVPAAVEDCAEKGVRYCLCIASGFADAGSEGEAMQQRITEVARASGMRLVGPNSAGLVSLRAGLVAKSAYAFRQPVPVGGLAFITQSGSLSTTLSLQLDQLGIRYSHILDTGNEADIGFLEVAEDLLEDPDVAMIAGYVEAFRGGERLLQVGRKALAAGVPIVVLGPQNPVAMGEAVRSHTGNVVRSDAAARRAVFEQAGIISTGSTDEFCDLIATYTAVRDTPDLDGIGVVSGSGGAGILLADACLRAGLSVPTLADATRARLREILPSFASAQNPVDVTGAALDHPEYIEQAIGALLEDPKIDAIVHNFGRHHGAERVMKDAGAVIQRKKSSDKPMFIFSVRSDHNQPAIDLLRQAGLPVLHDTERLARVVAGLRLRARAKLALSDGAPADLRPLSPPSGTPSESELFAMLAAAGLPVTVSLPASTVAEAVATAQQVGYPVVLKAVVPGLLHKTEAGGVRLKIADEARLRLAYAELADIPGSTGVLVQRMLRGGLEVVVGFTRSSDFGPIAMVGLGGTTVELLRAVTFRALPLGPRDVQDLIDGSPVGRLLSGYRGAPALDRRALSDAIRIAADIFYASEWMHELDLNPIIVLPDGSGACVVDAALVIGPG